MLGLRYETPPEWAERVLAQPGPLLLDHLFLERKAAGTARHLAKILGNEHPAIGRRLREIEREEEEHAALVETFLCGHPGARISRGGNLYVRRLRRLVHETGRGSLLARILIAGLVEARSAERFRLLARAARGTALGRFYEDLYASEVGHHVFFTRLACDLFGEGRALAELERLREDEAAVVRSLPPGPRLH